MFDEIADKVIGWIGSTNSIVLHTLFFVFIFCLQFTGIATDTVLLILTTIVSLEAIYLSIFIQRAGKQSSAAITAVAKDIKEASVDIEQIQGDIDQLQTNGEQKPSKEPLIKQLRKLRQSMSEHEKMLADLEVQLEELAQK